MPLELPQPRRRSELARAEDDVSGRAGALERGTRRADRHARARNAENASSVSGRGVDGTRGAPQIQVPISIPRPADQRDHRRPQSRSPSSTHEKRPASPASSGSSPPYVLNPLPEFFHISFPERVTLLGLSAPRSRSSPDRPRGHAVACRPRCTSPLAEIRDLRRLGSGKASQPARTSRSRRSTARANAIYVQVHVVPPGSVHSRPRSDIAGRRSFGTIVYPTACMPMPSSHEIPLSPRCSRSAATDVRPRIRRRRFGCS